MTTRTPPLLLHIEGKRVPGRDREQLLAENERLRAEVARLRAGEEPAELHQPVTAGGHLLWALNHSSPEVRLTMAGALLSAMRHSNDCFEGDHDTRLRLYKDRVARLEGALRAASEEASRLSEVSDGAGRGVALTIGFVLTQRSGGLV
ncbi:hypothetical protein ACPCSC_30800 [Streptomyces lavendulocolor]|uniref:hypothetical protein n=1 Tax=Streptomyces lavendulocolor TaxID=67316 RepID=UPI003C301975